jgi:uridine kinase
VPEEKSKEKSDLDRLNEWRRYQSTLSIILCTAVRKLHPKSRLRIEHSMSKGLYCTLGKTLTASDVKKIQASMHTLVEDNLPIQRARFPKKKAIYLFKNLDQPDKVMLLKNIRRQSVTLYSLLDLYDMYAIPPFDTTEQTSNFYLRNFPPGFIMVGPTWQDLSRLPEFLPQPKLARIFNEYVEWAKILGIDDVGPLNQMIKQGHGPEIIKIVEALHEKKIAYIADRIAREKSKVVLIAGPSSAGKTTFTKRLAIQLIVNGMKPLIVSTDNYFYPHSKTPRDESGRFDFESLAAVDVKLLNRHLLDIIESKQVSMPRFNFHTGRRNKGSTVKPDKDSVILLEGIHCLNNELTYKVPGSVKFKIYVSALTQLNIDDHNRISTTDTRMIRRITRDTYFRGYRVQEVLRIWSSVRRGEEENVYPFQEDADEMFNSALIYEPAVHKRFCVPILRKIKKTAPEYEEAKRILNFLGLFYDLPDHDVPSNSILREFIGGSSFVY